MFRTLQRVRGISLPSLTTTLSTSATTPAPETTTTTTTGYVHSVESFSAVDGEGLRYMVFLQGCRLRCVFCSNPDTWEVGSKGGAGNRMSVGEVAEKIRRCVPYLRAGKGGVTVSGGEPLLQPQFVADLFKQVRSMGLTTALDTAGISSRSAWDIVLPETDMVLFCFKGLTEPEFESVARSPEYARSQAFIKRVGEEGIPVWLRYVLAPGLNDNPASFDRVVEFAQSLPTLHGVDLLPLHHLGAPKWEALGEPYPMADVSPPDPGVVDALAARLETLGVPVLHV